MARRQVTFATSDIHRLLRHEAEVHAVPDRRIRDLGDSFLLEDPTDPEPFWNRMEAIRFPSAPDAFDRRLAEVGILFAGIARQPHLWLLPPHDQPADLYRRLVANGFEDVGSGHLMIATDGARARDIAAHGAASPGRPSGVTIERHQGLVGPAADPVSEAIVSVLLDGFAVGTGRRPALLVETRASLADPRFTHYLIRRESAPLAVTRRATFEGLSYLSSITTVAAARGQGLGRLVTAVATADGFAAGSRMVHLGVHDTNLAARRLYEGLGFAYAGQPGPDMLLVG
jgi:ribosomal protein S18 acetylase RimI-like enzyme